MSNTWVWGYQLGLASWLPMGWGGGTPRSNKILEMALVLFMRLGFPGGSEVKASAWNAGDPGLIPGLGRSPGEGNDNPLLYTCLENPMKGGAW